jgi:tetratricopeptide (TPR) repeat protein
MKRWLSVPSAVLAAAAVLVAVALSWLLFLKPGDPSGVADRYIGEHLVYLGVKMGEPDAMQTGLDLYNRGKLPEALRQFETTLLADSLNQAAQLDAGIVSLRMGNYDQALAYFAKLESHTNPAINPALFYHALTLLKRNRDGDADFAKQVLNRIVQQGLDKRDEAKELLGKL